MIAVLSVAAIGILLSLPIWLDGSDCPDNCPECEARSRAT